MLSLEDIEEINNNVNDSWYEGVFIEPTYIPIHIKEPVVYMRWESGGYSGGSCWNDEVSQRYENSKPSFTVLDLVLEKLNITLTDSLYMGLNNIVHTNSESEYEYYGNSTEYQIEYIILSELYSFIRKYKISKLLNE